MASPRGLHCWERRGCEGVIGLTDPMEQECPHSRDDCYSPCPIDCRYAQCMRPTHEVASDVNLLLDPTVDRTAPIKEVCRYCAFFLTHGPRLGADGPMHEAPQKATVGDKGRSTVHFF